VSGELSVLHIKNSTLPLTNKKIDQSINRSS
jgi:hypothetical protein